MVLVTAGPIMNGNHTTEKDPNSELSPSGFTAVNGREPLSNGINGNGINGLGGINGSPKSNERATRDSGDRRENQGSNHSSSRHPSPPSRADDNRREMTNVDHQNMLHLNSYQGDAGFHKRKRSESQSEDAESSSSSSQDDDESPPRRTGQTPHRIVDLRINGTTSTESGQHHTSQHGDRAAQHQYSNVPNGDGQVQAHGNPWHDRGAMPPNYHMNGNRLDASDAQLAEALQRDVQGQDTPSKQWQMMNRSEEDSGDADSQRYAAYGQERSSKGAVHVGPKRKRIFSNRTKTGCLTCRRRKKKCDELHPQCNNCMRGGFTCEGYNVRNPWQKPSNAKGPVPLQSKDGYPDVADQPYQAEEHSPRQKRSSVHHETVKVRPIAPDDGDHSHSQFMTSPASAGPRRRGSYSTQPWPNSANSAYMQEQHIPKPGYRDLPPFAEVVRGEPGKPEYGGMPPIREIPRPMHSISQTHPPAPAAGSWQGHPPPPPVEYQATTYPNHVNSNNPQATARLALSIEHAHSSTKNFTGEDAEKQKMLRGFPFKFTDPVLSDEREHCRSALWRFNNAANPVNGISEKERFRLLQDVLQPSRDRFREVDRPKKFRAIGEACPGSLVETPFKCHYGYNVKLGEDVYIGENCIIIDSCSVSIGSKTWIGPNVTLITAQASRDMVDREGANSTWHGSSITIEEEVWVGAGVTIYPGVTLKRGSTVEPGTVVRKTVEQNAVLAPTPAHMSSM